MNQQQEKNNIEKSDASDELGFLDEPLTIALVLKGSAEAIQELKSFLTQSELKLIYKTVSFGHLYITTKEEKK